MSDEKESYKPAPGKGIHPRECSQHHCEVAAEVLHRALLAARMDLRDIDAIAYSCGPGLGPCLRTGATVARALSAYYGKPMVPVNHAVAHIEIACLTSKAADPLVVLVSGGHSCLTAFAGGRWRILGETEDITIGNLLDAFARQAGLPSPGGPQIEKAARNGSKLVAMPYVVKGNDFSYSGLLTATINEFKKAPDALSDICFSLQETSFAMLAEAAERTLAFTEKKELLLTGGVAANQRLQEMLRLVAEDHSAAFHVVPREYSGDCGAQIAFTGVLAYSSGLTVEIEESYVKPRWRLDIVPAPWRREATV